MDKRGNISSRNMRLFAAIMTLIEALVLTSLAGCAGKKVDYGVDTEVKEQKNASNGCWERGSMRKCVIIGLM